MFPMKWKNCIIYCDNTVLNVIAFWREFLIIKYISMKTFIFIWILVQMKRQLFLEFARNVPHAEFGSIQQ